MQDIDDDMEMFYEEQPENPNSKAQPREDKPAARSRNQKRVIIQSDSDELDEEEPYEDSESEF